MASAPKEYGFLIGPDGQMRIAPRAVMTGRADPPSMLTRLERWLTRWFACTLLDGGGRCPYLRRWRLAHRRGWGTVYLHHFIGDDWSRDLHDHSGRFVSIGLHGSYREITPAGSRTWTAPWIRQFPATHVHRLELVTPRVWTLVWVGPTSRLSGFWVKGSWVLSKTYRASARADTEKAC